MPQKPYHKTAILRHFFVTWQKPHKIGLFKDISLAKKTINKKIGQKLNKGAKTDMIKKQTIEYKIVSIIGLAGEIQTEEIYKLKYVLML